MSVSVSVSLNFKMSQHMTFPTKKERYVASWDDVGAIPCTHACLNDSGVWRDLGGMNANDAYQTVFEFNDICYFYCKLIFRGISF